MSEAARLRLARQALATACPWCGQPAGQPCMTPDPKALAWPHEQRQARWWQLTRGRVSDRS